MTTVIIDQMSVDAPSANGIYSCIEDQVRYTPGVDIRLIGFSSISPGREWRVMEFAGRPVPFLNVQPRGSRRIIRRFPDSLKLWIGVMRRARMLPRNAVYQAHRVETGWMLGVVLRRNFVQFIHNDSTGLLGGSSESVWSKIPWLYRRLERGALRRALDVVLFNESDASRLRQFRPDLAVQKTGWRPDLVPTHAVRPKPGRVEIIWVGRYEDQKRPLLAIAVAAVLHERGVDVRLRMFGAGSLRGSMEEFRDKLGLHASVVDFCVPVSRAEIYAEMSSSSVLLMTSAYEGSPTVLVEANANGIPVAATQQSDPDLHLVTGVNGATSLSDEPEDLANVVVGCLDTPQDSCRDSVASRSATALSVELALRGERALAARKLNDGSEAGSRH